MITLYGSDTSPYARKVRLLLAELDLEFKQIQMNAALMDDDYVRMNPNMRVPTIQDGGLILFESNLILDYLLSTYGAKAGSNGTPPLAKTMARESHLWPDRAILATIETSLNSGINLLSMKRSGVDAEQADYLQREQRRIQSNLDWLDRQAGSEGFIPGVFSIQDVNLMCLLQWFEFRDICKWRDRAALDSIVGRYAERPSVSATYPEE